MAYRFTDTEKWNDAWFCGLSPSYKLFWNYLCDQCNHAGIWKVNWPVVKFHCWEDKFDVEIFGDRIVVISDEKWFIKNFVLFQQKISNLNDLNHLNIAHASIIKILKSEGLLSPLEAPCKGLSSPCQGVIVEYSNSNSKIPNKDEGYGEKEKQDLFAEMISQYPNKDGSKEAWVFFQKTVITKQDAIDIKKAFDNYLTTREVKNGFIKSAEKWFGRWRDFVKNASSDQDPLAKWRAEK